MNETVKILAAHINAVRRALPDNASALRQQLLKATDALENGTPFDDVSEQLRAVALALSVSSDVVRALGEIRRALKHAQTESVRDKLEEANRINDRTLSRFGGRR